MRKQTIELKTQYNTTKKQSIKQQNLLIENYSTVKHFRLNKLK